MYKLLLYYLILLVGVAFVYCFLGWLAFNPFTLIFSTLFLTAVCYITNKIFAYVFDVPANAESVYITALILALIITPLHSYHDLPFLFWAGVLSMSSKFIIAYKRKHIFNPAAFAIVVTALTGIGSASWWIGTLPMLPFALLGVLVVRKIRRFDLVFYYFIAALATIVGLSMLKGSDPFTIIRATFSESPILFFAFVMLTEPLTAPPTKKLQIIYGVLIGILFSPQLKIAGNYTTPEIALLVGNIFSYAVSPKIKYILKLKEKVAIGENIVDFIFPRPTGFVFTPGQYMEWTLPHAKIDSRGNRRYFTIASSPTEDTVRLGVRFYPNGSSFKKSLILLEPKTPLLAGQLAGDFTLPQDQNRKLVFIAGGIGITPYRSMVKYLVDKNERRDIVVIHINKVAKDAVYMDVLNDAHDKLGIKVVHTLTDEKTITSDWRGRVGRLTQQMIKDEVSDYSSRTFYISGSQAVVDSTKELLKSMKIPDRQIITDYFPGF